MSTEQQTKPKRRYFMWFFLAVQVIFVIWVIAGVNSGSAPVHCDGLAYRDCREASNAGTAIGVGIVIFLWATADLILGAIWAITKFARR